MVVVVVVKNMTAASWLNQPIRKNMRTVKLDHLPRGRGENNQHLQPPPRLMFISFKLVLVPSWEVTCRFFEAMSSRTSHSVGYYVSVPWKLRLQF